jgi:uncharacterized membrane protein
MAKRFTGKDEKDSNSAEELTARNVRKIADLDQAAHARLSTSDRIASAISCFVGSMPFVWFHVIFFTAWILWNTVLPVPRIDPFPFTFLTLVVSLEAIFLSTFIMIAENRQEEISDRRSQLDLQINLLAEQENTKQLQLLEDIARKLGIDPAKHPGVRALEEATKPEKLIQQIDAHKKKKANA